MAELPGAALAETLTRFLTFRANGRLYALPASQVAEIIPVPPVAKLPQSPKSLLGMANLRGSVIAVASLRALLGHEAEVPGSLARAIVLDGASPVAITIDTVETLVTLEDAHIETRQSKLVAEPGELLNGAFLNGTDAGAAKILDMPALLARAFMPRAAAKPAGSQKIPAAQGSVQRAGQQQSETRALVTFEVANQAYALPLSEIREIIALPPAIAAVPRAEALILGLASYRDALLPLLSLRGLLGFPLQNDARNKVVVTSVAGVLVGLVADRMREIVHADVGQIEPAPSLLAARAGGETRIDQIYRAENGRLISLLATEKLFGDEVMARLGNHSTTESTAPEAAGTQQLQYLVFRLGNEEFALPISAVDEVAAVPEKITRLPKTPKFLSGVVNLRGEVLPVIDQRSRFDLPKFSDDGGRQRLIVVRSARHQAGLIVDGISEVLSAPSEWVGPAPHLAGEESRLVRGVLNLEASGRLILVLDPDELLTRTERSLLDNFNATRPAAKTADATGKTPKPRKAAQTNP
jgi:purine-binding chemotaxis protein CheW